MQEDTRAESQNESLREFTCIFIYLLYIFFYCLDGSIGQSYSKWLFAQIPRILIASIYDLLAFDQRCEELRDMFMKRNILGKRYSIPSIRLYQTFFSWTGDRPSTAVCIYIFFFSYFFLIFLLHFSSCIDLRENALIYNGVCHVSHHTSLFFFLILSSVPHFSNSFFSI